eukprot:COSAG01_NODE_424_length_17253_cov_31.601900_20_plen_164_part_00
MDEKGGAGARYAGGADGTLDTVGYAQSRALVTDDGRDFTNLASPPCGQVEERLGAVNQYSTDISQGGGAGNPYTLPIEAPTSHTLSYTQTHVLISPWYPPLPRCSLGTSTGTLCIVVVVVGVVAELGRQGAGLWAVPAMMTIPHARPHVHAQSIMRSTPPLAR